MIEFILKLMHESDIFMRFKFLYLVSAGEFMHKLSLIIFPEFRC